VIINAILNIAAFDKNDLTRGIIFSILDITKRKQAEEALRQSEEKYRLIVEEMLDVIFTTNFQEEFAYVSPSVKNVLGYEPLELVGKRFMSLVHPQDLPAMAEQIKQSYNVGYHSSVENEYRLRHASGEWRWVVSRGTRVVDTKGDFLYFIGIIKDITARKQAEEALKQSEEKYSTLIEQSIDGILIIQNRLVVFANHRMSEMFGYSQDEILGKYFYQLAAPENKEMLDNEYHRRQAGEYISGNHELGILAKDHRKIPVETKVQPIVYQEKPAFMVIIRDITERKQAEDALKESEARFHELYENSPLGLYRTTPDGRILMANPALIEMLGYSDFAELSNRNLDSGAFEPSYPRKQFIENIERNGVIQGYEYTWKRKDGTSIQVRENARAIRDASGNILFFDGTVENITEHKETENALKESEQRYRSLFENMTNGYAYCRMFYQDEQPVDFQYINVNKAFETQTGLTGVDGKLVSEVIPGIRESDPELFARYGRVALTGVPESFEMFVASLNMWFSISVYSSQREYFVAIFDLITERKQAEAKILSSLAEKETLLKEVHHRVKNNMQVISSLLRLQEGRVKDKAAAELLKDSQNRIQSMSLVYNKLYQSENLASVNMTDYFKELSTGLVKSYAVSPARVTVNVAQSNVFLSVDSAIPCGMIINELVTNSLKYAFPDNRKGLITISLTEDGKGLKLTVSDNGVGIPADVSLSNIPTLGIKLVSNLVRDQLGGTIELDRRHGSTYQINFPRTKEEK
jgi:PAS domain S-box-containing protein